MGILGETLKELMLLREEETGRPQQRHFRDVQPP